MVEKSLAQLREEKKRLTKEFEGSERKRLENIEKRKLKSEIRALRHPESTLAIKSFLKSAKKATFATGRFIRKRANIIDENLRRAEMDQLRRKRGKVGSTGKKKTKKKTRKK